VADVCGGAVCEKALYLEWELIADGLQVKCRGSDVDPTGDELRS
jgi:hypothetical protein